MTRDAEIPTIFNPSGGGGVSAAGRGRGVRTPSVVVTAEEQQNNCRNSTNGPYSQPTTPQIHHADSSK